MILSVEMLFRKRKKSQIVFKSIRNRLRKFVKDYCIQNHISEYRINVRQNVWEKRKKRSITYLDVAASRIRPLALTDGETATFVRWQTSTRYYRAARTDFTSLPACLPRRKVVAVSAATLIKT